MDVGHDLANRCASTGGSCLVIERGVDLVVPEGA